MLQISTDMILSDNISMCFTDIASVFLGRSGVKQPVHVQLGLAFAFPSLLLLWEARKCQLFLFAKSPPQGVPIGCTTVLPGPLGWWLIEEVCDWIQWRGTTCRTAREDSRDGFMGESQQGSLLFWIDYRRSFTKVKDERRVWAAPTAPPEIFSPPAGPKRYKT